MSHGAQEQTMCSGFRESAREVKFTQFGWRCSMSTDDCEVVFDDFVGGASNALFAENARALLQRDRLQAELETELIDLKLRLEVLIARIKKDKTQ